MRRIFPLLFPILWITGCATQPVPIASPVALPEQWRHPSAADSGINADWWRTFGNDELDHLIRQATAESLDIATAVARVHQAYATVRIAQAALLPELVLGLNITRRDHLENSNNGNFSNYGALLSASYEVDFWRRNRASRDSAVAVLHATEFDRDTVRLTVTTGVASTWLRAVALHERIAIAELNLQNAERLLTMVESRERAGTAMPLALVQQRGLVANQRRFLSILRQQAGDTHTALEVLLAQPGRVEIGKTSLASLHTPAMGTGLPSELLTRRPDIARAEARLAAANASVVVARTAMFPRLILLGGIGADSDHLHRIFDHPMYSLAAGLTAPIFNAGRLAAGHDLALAQREELLAGYRQAIIAAFADVEIALNAVTELEAQVRLQTEELTQAQHALILAESRYRAGAETLLDLLDAQRTLYAAKDIAVQLKLSRLLASVALYKALGGGWQADQSLTVSVF